MLKDSKTGKIHKASESEPEPTIEAYEEETGKTTEVEEGGERTVKEQVEEKEPEPELETEEAPAEEETGLPGSGAATSRTDTR